MGNVVPARVRARRSSAGTLVTLGPYLGDRDAPYLRAALLRSWGRVTVDAGWVGRMSDSCLAALFGGAAFCGAGGRPVVFLRVSPSLRRRLESVGLGSVVAGGELLGSVQACAGDAARQQ
jgi:anti-anti-sigma regulatory factor